MTTHIAVIGAYGSAGTAVAQALVDEPNVELTLIDDGDPGGGLCILRGCMPSKEVLSVAAHRFQTRNDDRIDGEGPVVDLETVVERKNEHVENFASHRTDGVAKLAERSNVEFVGGTATFVGERTLLVDDRTIEPDYVVVATGSALNVPDLPGIEEISFKTSADVLDMTVAPDSGIVMGFGYVGLELVPYLSEAVGVDLTVIEHDDRPLDEADPTFGTELIGLYREKFDVEILTNTYERRVEPTDDGRVRLTLDRDGVRVTREADELFVFTGRNPNVAGLGLEAAGISLTGDWVDDTMQTVANERVFVVGDANGKEPILHVAKEQGALAAQNVLSHRNGETLTEYENVHHHVVFSGLGVYPYARVGHSEASAEAAGFETISITRRASSDGVFKTKDVPEGLATLVVDANDGTVLGYQGLHYHADVMAKTMQIVVELGLDVRTIPDRSYHPTTPEIMDGLIRDASDRFERMADAMPSAEVPR